MGLRQPNQMTPEERAELKRRMGNMPPEGVERFKALLRDRGEPEYQTSPLRAPGERHPYEERILDQPGAEVPGRYSFDPKVITGAPPAEVPGQYRMAPKTITGRPPAGPTFADEKARLAEANNAVKQAPENLEVKTTTKSDGTKVETKSAGKDQKIQTKTDENGNITQVTTTNKDPLRERPLGGGQTFATSGTLTEDAEVWNGVGGVRGKINLGASNWYIPYYADVGAGDSELTWQLFTALGYSFNKWEVGLGYRHLVFEADDDSIVDNISMSGPIIGASYNF